MALHLIQCGPTVPEGCQEIFQNSAIYTRYFQDGRLERLSLESGPNG